MNIIVENNQVKYAPSENVGLAYNLLQQLQLILGEDKFYSDRGIDWISVKELGLPIIPVLASCGALSYPYKFTVQYTEIEKNSLYEVKILLSEQNIVSIVKV